MTDTPHVESKPTRKHRSLKTYAIWLVAAVLFGFVLSTAIRFALIKDDSIHYHANFALYINGKRDELKSFTFYEEVAACDASAADNPKVRVHLHDNNGQLVHVHGGGVTWGHLFQNLGYTLSNDLVGTDSGVYITGDDGNKLSFVLNGESTNVIANELIESEDVLLINYGKDDQSTLQSRYDSIPRDAGKANTTRDPAACAGAHEFNTWERLKQALGVSSGQH
jgi:hypothetical protein